MNDLVMADTLWAIERIEEVGGRVVSAFFWNETRKLVIRYSEIPTFTHSRLSYAEFADSLKTITEKFYKNRIDSKVNTFGAPLVFISRITKDRIETYYFYD